jgi:hypothetical protein
MYAMLNQPVWLGDVGVLDVRDGDVIVLRVEGRMTIERMDYLSQKIKSVINKRVKVLVLDDGMDIGVVREG